MSGFLYNCNITGNMVIFWLVVMLGIVTILWIMELTRKNE